jgi:hypothetical protein
MINNQKGWYRMSENSKEKIRAEIEKALSGKPYIFRQDKQRQAIDGLSPGVLSNMDAAGKGVTGAVMIGRKIAYPIDSYVDWVCSRITEVAK